MVLFPSKQLPFQEGVLTAARRKKFYSRLRS